MNKGADYDVDGVILLYLYVKVKGISKNIFSPDNRGFMAALREFLSENSIIKL